MADKGISFEGQWALILGASSGFGGATALELAGIGMNIFGVHLDTRATLPNAQKIAAQIEEMGREAVFFNANAANVEKRRETLERMLERMQKDGSTVAVLLHSLAFGTLKPYVGPSPEESITQAQLEMTLDVMANSLVYWVQGLVGRGMMVKGARVFAMTSAGDQRVIPTYGAVSAAKAALESHIRQLATELGPQGITVNAIKAGITDTPALRRIPGHERLLEEAKRRNPSGRITTPEDISGAIAALCTAQTQWLTGGVISVDGGEDIVV